MCPPPPHPLWPRRPQNSLGLIGLRKITLVLANGEPEYQHLDVKIGNYINIMHNSVGRLFSKFTFPSTLFNSSHLFTAALDTVWAFN